MIVLTGTNLTIRDILAAARRGEKVSLTEDPAILARVERSCDYIKDAVNNERPILGVTSGFGGMSGVTISPEMAADLQNTIMWNHKVGAGKLLPREDVRAAMLIRANSHLHGASGIRLEIIRRIVTFLNAGVTPQVREFGSIGASGDLVPLTQITGALIGADKRFIVDFAGEEVDSITALDRLQLKPLPLLPKEGLAMVNGTSVMTGIASNCVHDAQTLFGLSMGVHAFVLQALKATNQSFHPFIHARKPHPGQTWAAARMLQLLEGSTFVRDELSGRRNRPAEGLLTDRYSLRCLPQYLGPIVDGFAQIAAQITAEANSATDNPLIDVESQIDFQGGNFLGQYVGVAMDQLRYYLGLLAKHIDVQISLLVAPEYNRGLPGSLVGNTDNKVNMGLKGLQITGNSIMPLLSYLGNSLADRYPVHAEQFNQNINSQGFGSANLARQSIATFQQYMAVALIFAVQACDLRSHVENRSCDPRGSLSPATRRLYEAVREVVGRPPSHDRPLVWDDREQMVDEWVAKIADDIAADGVIPNCGVAA